SVWQAARYNATFLLVIGLLLIAFAPLIVSLFSTDAEIIRYGSDCLRILGLGYPMYAVGMIIIQALNGAGDTLTPSFLNFICFWLVQILLAYVLATVADLGPHGVFWSFDISESMNTVIGVMVFHKGRWKLQQV